MENSALQPYVERATKAEEMIVELKKQIAYLEAIVYSKNNTYYDPAKISEQEQKSDKTKENTEDKTKENTGDKTEENTGDKTKKIEDFLAHRPKPNEVGINVNIAPALYDTIRHLEYEKKRDSIHQYVTDRPSKEDLKNHGILEYTELAPSLQATAHTLEKEITKDKLEKKVENRPSPDVVGVNINLSSNLAKVAYDLEKEQLKDKFTAAFNETKGIHAYSQDTNIAPYSNIAPSLQPAAAQLDHHQRRHSLDKLLHPQLFKDHPYTESNNNNTQTSQTSQMSPQSWIIQCLKEIRADVVTLVAEKKQLEEALACRDLLAKDYRRSLHWCIKIGNLNKSLEFFSNALGMKVLRHEEFSSQCDAKCNGDYNSPWSKTMIGYGDEHTNFALELTYTYGIKGYRRGNDLRYIGIYVTEDSIQKAEKLGYKTTKIETKGDEPVYEIIGPDDVCIHAQVVKQVPKEPFWSVALNVTNIKQTFDYWIGTLDLNLHCLSYTENTFLRCSYDSQVAMEFYQLQNNEKLDHGKAQGRIAFSTRIENGPAVICNYIKARRYKIHTNPVTLPTPGKADVNVVILQDPDDYEICFVGEKGFDDLCKTKHGDDTIDWKRRQENGGDQDKGKIDH